MQIKMLHVRIAWLGKWDFLLVYGFGLYQKFHTLLSSGQKSNLSILLIFYCYVILKTCKCTLEFQIVRVGEINGEVGKLLVINKQHGWNRLGGWRFCSK